MTDNRKWYELPRDCVSCKEEFIAMQYNQGKCIFCLRKEDKRFSFDRIIKECKGCGKDFVRRSMTQTYCTRQCNLDNSYLLRTYRITKQEYEQMLDEQGNVCIICGRGNEEVKTRMHLRLVVDHCHTTDKVRGLLCHRCNQGLGLFYDDTTALRNAADYIEKFEILP